jgi:hypothetical protein
VPKIFPSTTDPGVPPNAPSTRSIRVGHLDPEQIAELVLLKSAGPTEAHGHLESGLLPETLNDSFKADRRDLFVRILKVHVQNDLCPWDQRLLQCYSRPADPNVVKHALHFCLVVWSIGKVDSHRASDLESPLFAHGVGLSNFVQAITEAAHFRLISFVIARGKKNNRLSV